MTTLSGGSGEGEAKTSTLAHARVSSLESIIPGPIVNLDRSVKAT